MLMQPGIPVDDYIAPGVALWHGRLCQSHHHACHPHLIFHWLEHAQSVCCAPAARYGTSDLSQAFHPVQPRMHVVLIAGTARSGMSATSPSASSTSAVRHWPIAGRACGAALRATTMLAQSCRTKRKRRRLSGRAAELPKTLSFPKRNTFQARSVQIYLHVWVNKAMAVPSRHVCVNSQCARFVLCISCIQRARLRPCAAYKMTCGSGSCAPSVLMHDRHTM